MNRTRLQKIRPNAGWILAIVLLVNGGLPGAHSKPPAQPGGITAFKSGAQRSEEVLREMLTVLKRIDSRLERLETKTTTNTNANRNRGR